MRATRATIRDATAACRYRKCSSYFWRAAPIWAGIFKGTSSRFYVVSRGAALLDGGPSPLRGVTFWRTAVISLTVDHASRQERDRAVCVRTRGEPEGVSTIARMNILRQAGTQLVTIVHGEGTDEENRVEVQAHIQPEIGFFEVDAPIYEGDIVLVSDPREESNAVLPAT